MPQARPVPIINISPPDKRQKTDFKQENSLRPINTKTEEDVYKSIEVKNLDPGVPISPG